MKETTHIKAEYSTITGCNGNGQVQLDHKLFGSIHSHRNVIKVLLKLFKYIVAQFQCQLDRCALACPQQQLCVLSVVGR